MNYRGLMIMRWLAPADDQPQGGQQPKAGEGGSDQPQGVTLDQVNDIVNKALTARNKQVETKVEKLFTDFTTKFDTALDAKLAALKPAEPDPNAQQQKPATETPEYKALKRKMDELETGLANERKEKEQTAAAAQAQTLRQKVQDALATGGIAGKSLQYALGVLVDAEKRVRFDDDDKSRILFKGDDGDELPLADGVKAWLKSEDAKVFLPPRGTNGSGQRPPLPNPAGGTPSNAKPGELGKSLANVLFGPQTGMASDE